jgi:hypothetical protein
LGLRPRRGAAGLHVIIIYLSLAFFSPSFVHLRAVFLEFFYLKKQLILIVFYFYFCEDASDVGCKLLVMVISKNVSLKFDG